jgi:hypothetical protein
MRLIDASKPGRSQATISTRFYTRYISFSSDNHFISRHAYLHSNYSAIIVHVSERPREQSAFTVTLYSYLAGPESPNYWKGYSSDGNLLPSS